MTSSTRIINFYVNKILKNKNLVICGETEAFIVIMCKKGSDITVRHFRRFDHMNSRRWGGDSVGGAWFVFEEERKKMFITSNVNKN